MREKYMWRQRESMLHSSHNGGIVVSVDSRGWNEWVLQKKNPPPLFESTQIYNLRCY